ncbi:MAG: hypothetical protein HY817_01160 [Candidatus Abawacabacteria bacterium]|nr:hypothetical protein [Candidatus Abawacabacteria bacterium]
MADIWSGQGNASPSSAPSAPTSAPSAPSAAWRRTRDAVRGNFWKVLGVGALVATGYVAFTEGVSRIGTSSSDTSVQTSTDRRRADAREAAANSPSAIWEHGKQTMAWADTAERLIRAIEAQLATGEAHQDINFQYVGTMNDILQSPLLTDPAKQQMRLEVPNLAVAASDLTDSAKLAKIMRALQIARADISTLALSDFSGAAQGQPNPDMNWVGFVNSNLDNQISEPGHLSNIVLCLWRKGEMVPARNLASRIFELTSWSDYKREHPAEALDIVSICTRPGLLAQSPITTAEEAELRARSGR